jgi:hypothetical protein
MAKKTSLLDEVRQLPKAPSGNRKCWYHLLRERQPDLYEEIAEVVRDFNSGGDAYEVFRSAAQMHAFFLQKDQERKGPKALNGVGSCVFRRFVEYLRVNPND